MADLDFSKQPKWVKEHIKDLQRERDTAIQTLNEYIDDQTVSPFSTADLTCTGEGKGGAPVNKRRYIQAYRMEVRHGGVALDITLRDNFIDLAWGDWNTVSSSRGINDIACIPRSYQEIRLASHGNMR